MTDTRPLTSQEIDDGWHLDEALLAVDGGYYLEYSVKVMTADEFQATSAGFKKALLERNAGKRPKRRHGKASKRFGRRRRRRARFEGSE